MNIRPYLDGGRGQIRVLTGASPAPGADFSVNPPVTTVSQLIYFAARLTADANAANRLTILKANDGTSDYFLHPGPGLQTANEVIHYVWTPNIVGADLSGTVQFILGGLSSTMFIYPGSSIQLDITNIQVGDQISAIVYVLQEFPL